MSRLKDKLLEVELFVGEQIEDYTNEQVIEKFANDLDRRCMFNMQKNCLKNLEWN